MEKDKNTLRKHYQSLRAALTQAQLEQIGLKIANRALELPLWDFRFYHLYLPMLRHKEVDTHPLLTLLQGKDKQVVVPKVASATTLIHFLLKEDTHFAVNSWGIAEPLAGEMIDPSQLDVVFVPLLAYDMEGNRLGYGKGFYDRFLAECRPDCWRIGISSFAPEKTRLKALATDVPLHACLTPEKIYSFSTPEGKR